MTCNKYAKKDHYLEVHSRVKVVGKLVFREQRNGTEALSNLLGISGHIRPVL
jgi:hypothetical protein